MHMLPLFYQIKLTFWLLIHYKISVLRCFYPFYVSAIPVAGLISLLHRIQYIGFDFYKLYVKFP